MEQNNLIFTILAVVAIVLALAIIVLAIIYFKKRNKEGFKGIKIAIPVVVLAILLAVCAFFLYQSKCYRNAYNDALERGAQSTYLDENYPNLFSAGELEANNKIVPYDQASDALILWNSNQVPVGAEFVLYRYDCEDCHDIVPGLVEQNKDNPNYFFVCTRSDAGKELVSKWKNEYKIPIKNVPSKITHSSATDNEYIEF